MKDFTHTEARTAFKALLASIGPKAEGSVSISLSKWADGKSLLRCDLWPDGLVGQMQMSAAADTYRELLAAAEEAWAERSDLHAVETIRKMALAIISITADRGECTDAALRAEFDASEVKQYGERACAQATEMASNGPFSIVSLSGANDVGEAA